jgi:hypothetical protein
MFKCLCSNCRQTHQVAMQLAGLVPAGKSEVKQQLHVSQRCNSNWHHTPQVALQLASRTPAGTVTHQ